MRRTRVAIPKDQASGRRPGIADARVFRFRFLILICIEDRSYLDLREAGASARRFDRRG
jgi:hypothetical protein